MKSIVVVLFVVFCLTFNTTFSLSCDSCGSECQRACGTRHFRTCCFNYVRKRSNSFHPYALNRLNYDLLYGPPSFPESSSDEIEKIKGFSHEENKIADTDKFYKPYKDGELRQQIMQLQHRLSQSDPDSKQQFIFDT